LGCRPTMRKVGGGGNLHGLGAQRSQTKRSRHWTLPRPPSSRNHQSSLSDDDDDDEGPLALRDKDVPPHPHGVKPEGNRLVDMVAHGFAPTRDVGLGHLAPLPDHLIFAIFQEVGFRELVRLSMTSRAFYVLANYDELWKYVTLETFRGDWRFVQTWKQTFIGRLVPSWPLLGRERPIKVKHFYSTLLHHSWCLLTCDLMKWTRIDNIDRRSGLTLEQFITEYEIPNKPVVLTDVVPTWPCFKKWSKEGMIRDFGDMDVNINQGITMKLKDYFSYSEQAVEENPMYLFDSEFGEKRPNMLDDYSVPKYFPEDYFSYLEHPHRPSFRWILVGPARSGATFHKDPNHTSAWNGLLWGLKKWLLYPPNTIPPGTFPSDDEWEVTTPISIVEWFYNFYQETDKPEKKKSKSGLSSKNNQTDPQRPVECLLRPGDMIFIPNGWWHTVLNLEESVAVTQNYVSQQNVRNVLEFLRRKEKKTLFNELVIKLRERQPEALAQIEAAWAKEEEERLRKREDGSFWRKLKAGPSITTTSTAQNLFSSSSDSPFSFAFNLNPQQ
jgi:hypothetical protein